jgi:hypothetical protein
MTVKVEPQQGQPGGNPGMQQPPIAGPSPGAVTVTTATEALTPVAFQKKLMAHGFDLPQYGADGDWGNESEAATSAWFDTGMDLNSPEVTAPPDTGTVPKGIVPADWMPDCKMSKIIVHWTAGAYACSAVDKEHYHIIVDGDGKLWRGDKSIKANVSTSDNDGYAAHTKNCNSGSIGVSACCMANATESPFNPGNYPLKQIQWDTLAEVVAELAAKYGIACSPTTIMQHGEVEDNLGIAQDGKWDIMKLPWSSGMSGDDVGDQFRSKVSALL